MSEPVESKEEPKGRAVGTVKKQAGIKSCRLQSAVLQGSTLKTCSFAPN